MRQFAVVLLFLCRCCAGGQNEPIQTFVIPHSHMDVGWVYTVQVRFCHSILTFDLHIVCSLLFNNFHKPKPSIIYMLRMNACVFNLTSYV